MRARCLRVALDVGGCSPSHHSCLPVVALPLPRVPLRYVRSSAATVRRHVTAAHLRRARRRRARAAPGPRPSVPAPRAGSAAADTRARKRRAELHRDGAGASPRMARAGWPPFRFLTRQAILTCRGDRAFVVHVTGTRIRSCKRPSSTGSTTHCQQFHLLLQLLARSGFVFLDEEF